MHVDGGAALQLFAGNVFDAGPDPPDIAGRVAHAGVSVTVKLIRRLHQRDGSSLDGPVVGCVGIRNIEIDSGWHRLPGGSSIGDHHHRIANSNFGVSDAAVVPSHPLSLHCPECLPDKVDEPIGTLDDQVGNRTLVALRNWSDWHWCSSVRFMTHRSTRMHSED